MPKTVKAKPVETICTDLIAPLFQENAFEKIGKTEPPQATATSIDQEKVMAAVRWTFPEPNPESLFTIS